MRISFDNSYARLSERFYARVEPTPVSRPSLLQLNRGLAERPEDRPASCKEIVLELQGGWAR